VRLAQRQRCGRRIHTTLVPQRPRRAAVQRCRCSRRLEGDNVVAPRAPLDSFSFIDGRWANITACMRLLAAKYFETLSPRLWLGRCKPGPSAVITTRVERLAGQPWFSSCAARCPSRYPALEGGEFDCFRKPSEKFSCSPFAATEFSSEQVCRLLPERLRHHIPKQMRGPIDA